MEERKKRKKEKRERKKGGKRKIMTHKTQIVLTLPVV